MVGRPSLRNMKVTTATPSPATPLLNYPAAQQYLGGVSRSTMKQLVASRELRAISVRGRTMFRRDDLDAYVERHTPSGG